jgi:hypothetical protein
MTEEEVRERTAAICAALIAGDVGQVVEALSDELKRNPGEVVAMLPLPAVAAEVTRLEGSGGGAAYVALLEVTSETEHLELQLRWKDRDGEPRIVEVSHVSRRAREAEAEAAAAAEAEATGDGREGGEAGEGGESASRA